MVDRRRSRDHLAGDSIAASKRRSHYRERISKPRMSADRDRGSLQTSWGLNGDRSRALLKTARIPMRVQKLIQLQQHHLKPRTKMREKFRQSKPIDPTSSRD